MNLERLSKALASLFLMVAAFALPSTVPAHASPPAGLPQVALDWNLNAVTAVRAATTQIDGPARPMYQIEGLIYMSYVQAAVYDAVAKISGRYVPYHDFQANTAGAYTSTNVRQAAASAGSFSRTSRL